MMSVARWLMVCVAAAVLGLSGCDDKKKEPTEDEMVWSTDRLNRFRSQGQVPTVGDIYNDAYERALKDITVDKMYERLESLESRIKYGTGLPGWEWRQRRWRLMISRSPGSWWSV